MNNDQKQEMTRPSTMDRVLRALAAGMAPVAVGLGAPIPIHVVAGLLQSGGSSQPAEKHH
jgi:hypothetical protein